MTQVELSAMHGNILKTKMHTLHTLQCMSPYVIYMLFVVVVIANNKHDIFYYRRSRLKINECAHNLHLMNDLLIYETVACARVSKPERSTPEK